MVNKVDVAKIKYEHWLSKNTVDFSTTPLDYYRAGFEEGRRMEAAMWGLARGSQEWENDGYVYEGGLHQ